MSNAYEECRTSIERFIAACRNFGGMGYDVYWSSEEPDTLEHEAALSKMWTLYTALTDQERASLHAYVDADDTLFFFAYAVRMATLAVRERDPRHLVNGLLAVTLAHKTTDYRDFLTIMPPLRDAAIRLNASHVFDDMRRFAPASIQRFIFPPSADEEPSDVPGQFVVTNEVGFRYRRR